MTVIDQLRVSEKGDAIYLDAHINKASYFDGMHIGSVTIVTGDQLKESCSAAVDSHYVYKESFKDESGDSSTKEIHLVLSPAMLNEKFCKPSFSDDIFFVYIESVGTPAANTPCRLDERYTIGVTFDYAVIYNAALGYMRELGDRCSVPMGFIDMIMRYHALKISIETDHWLPAVDYFGMLKGAVAGQAPVRPCGCGRR